MAELRTLKDLTERGESAIIGALLPLPAAFILLPHLVLPGQSWPEAQGDLAVVVFAPGGAAVLGYHHWQGTVLAAPSPLPWRLRFAGGGEEERTNPLGVLDDQTRALAAFLEAQGVPAPKVVRALVFPERSRLDGPMPEVEVLSADMAAGWLQAELGSLAADATWPYRAADQLRPPSPARLVNQYQITSTLERQADHTVYLAFDTLASRRVILRELPFDPYQDPAQLDQVRKDLLREAKVTMELDHPGVVRVERVIPKDDRYYVVSEYLESCQSLRERLTQQGPLPEPEALDIAIQITTALAYAHAKGIVHRDLRPENILLSGSSAKVTGFGLAKKAELGTRATFDLRKLATESPYSAPELRLGQDAHHGADARADVYSLGVTLYEMLTGLQPGHLDERFFEPPSQFVRDIPASLDDAIAKALRFDPLQRFSTMNALRERLLQVRDRLPDPPDAPQQRYTDRRLVKRTPGSLIYQAQDRKLLRTVALKRVLIDPELAPDARKERLADVLREAALASTLLHPGIVQILDHFLEDDDAYIVMEWLEGRNLRELLTEAAGPLPVEQVQDVLAQVAEALLHAHSKGIIHRDIKPENVMIHHGRATLLDFGIAALAEVSKGQGKGRAELQSKGQGASNGRAVLQGDGQRAIQSTEQGFTPSSSIAGTAPYVAPEIWRGEGFDERADVFSLGVMAYELLTGQCPYPTSTLMARYRSPHADVAPISPTTVNTTVPKALAAAVMQAIAVDAADRFDDVEAFLEALDRLRGRSRKAKPAAGGRKALYALGALVLTGAGVAGAFAFGPFGPHSLKQPDTLFATPSTASGDVPLSTASSSMAAALALLASSSASGAPVASAATSPSPALAAGAAVAAGATAAVAAGLGASPLPAGAPPVATPATPVPTITPASAVSWASSPQQIGGVTIQIESANTQAGRTLVRLRIQNDSAAPVTLLDQPGSLLISDSKGGDYSGSVDYSSIPAALQNIGPGQQEEGSFIFDHGVDRDATDLQFTFKENGGPNRVFSLDAHRIEP